MFPHDPDGKLYPRSPEEAFGPDDAPQTGQIVGETDEASNVADRSVVVRLWRFPTGDGRSITYRPYKPTGVYSEPGVWHSLDPKALAAMRETLEDLQLDQMVDPNDVISAVMQALGLTPPEPKEGGAS